MITNVSHVNISTLTDPCPYAVVGARRIVLFDSYRYIEYAYVHRSAHSTWTPTGKFE